MKCRLLYFQKLLRKPIPLVRKVVVKNMDVKMIYAIALYELLKLLVAFVLALVLSCLGYLIWIKRKRMSLKYNRANLRKHHMEKRQNIPSRLEDKVDQLKDNRMSSFHQKKLKERSHKEVTWKPQKQQPFYRQLSACLREEETSDNNQQQEFSCWPQRISC